MLLHICGIGLQELYGGSLHRQINDVMNMDLRDSADDQSQRMLNALEPQASGCPARPGMTEGGEVIVWL